MKLKSIIFLLSLAGSQLYAQIVVYKPEVNPDLMTQQWHSFWITSPDLNENNYNVCHFRKDFELTVQPEKFVIHVSADNYYRLFINGKAVGTGPARNDFMHWNFDTYNIAKHLHQGKNSIAAVVWNFGNYAPNALKTRNEYFLSFLLQGNTQQEEIVNTNNSWKVLNNKAYSPNVVNMEVSVGAFETTDGTCYPWNWEKSDFNDSGWKNANTQQHGFTQNAQASWINRMLQVRPIPMPDENPEKIAACVRKSDKLFTVDFINKKTSSRVPANSTLTLLFDQGYLTNSFPELTVSKGNGSTIKLTYAEGLFDKTGNKQNRNKVEDLQIKGNCDLFKPDGGDQRMFRPLFFRTYRYLEMEITTGDEDLFIDFFTGNSTGYPFRENAYFKSAEPQLAKIWETGWRTAKLCAYETYTDCPYYEQLQYIGDTRIQALISLCVSGDDQLMRNAIEQFNNSRFEFGLTSSCYPSVHNQIIPPFSLFWILMINDYNQYRDDQLFCKKFVPGIKAILDWHNQFIGESGMLEKLPFWNFVDWPDEWVWDNSTMIGGLPEGALSGASSVLNLQYAYTLTQTAALFSSWGLKTEAEKYLETAEKIKRAVMKNCWDEKRQLLADSPLKHDLSQHANLWVILCDLIPAEKQAVFFKQINEDKSLIQCTIYYRFYLMRAMVKAGLGDLYVDQLQPWKTMLDVGLTTFAERPEPSRSDCHAWSASPNYEFLSTICGIVPAEPGFKTVKIEPALGPLQWIEGKMPHPKGEIKVSLKRAGENGIEGEVTLPDAVTGSFIWHGKTISLIGGLQKIRL